MIYACYAMKQRDRSVRDRMVVGFQLPMQSVPITSNVVSVNPAKARFTQYNILL